MRVQLSIEPRIASTARAGVASRENSSPISAARSASHLLSSTLGSVPASGSAVSGTLGEKVFELCGQGLWVVVVKASERLNVDGAVGRARRDGGGCRQNGASDINQPSTTGESVRLSADASFTTVLNLGFVICCGRFLVVGFEDVGFKIDRDVEGRQGAAHPGLRAVDRVGDFFEIEG